MIKTIFTDFRTAIAAGLIIAVTIVIALVFKYVTEEYIRKLMSYKHIDPTSYLFARR